MALNIFDPKYDYANGSKANRLRGFWQVADDSLVSASINHLLTYIDSLARQPAKTSELEFPRDRGQCS